MAVNETYIEIQDEVLAERTWGSVAKDLIRRQPLGAAGGAKWLAADQVFGDAAPCPLRKHLILNFNVCFIDSHVPTSNCPN